MNFPGSHKKVWKLWVWLVNVLKCIWQIIRQIHQAGEKIMVPAWEVIECFESRHIGFCQDWRGGRAPAGCLKCGGKVALTSLWNFWADGWIWPVWWGLCPARPDPAGRTQLVHLCSPWRCSQLLGQDQLPYLWDTHKIVSALFPLALGSICRVPSQEGLCCEGHQQ